jgi:UDPglucose--hexose-1-phosphate uridylyltransferase
MSDSLFSLPHRRYNPLTDEWILVSPHRTQRPWLGQVEKSASDKIERYDPKCYLCPGNERANGAHNPQYDATFVFDNDFAALLSPPPQSSPVVNRGGGILDAQPERGICRVICFSPRHDLTLPDLSVTEIRRVVDAWVEQTIDLGSREFVQYVQVFENKGAMMGASNPHPHGQVWANEHVPTEPAKELKSLAAYRAEHESCLLCDYLKVELEARERIVCENDAFVALVPFWATWPFETMVIARRHFGALPEMLDDERNALADVVKRLTTRYDNLFQTWFPYSMGFHQSPMDGAPYPQAHLHAHYYPPLLRSATVRKFMVGYEMLGEPQRDITPEMAAARLREMSEMLYRSVQ